jgi:D-aspartate ligase
MPTGKTRPGYRDAMEVVVTSGTGANTLGVVRSLGRHNIPVIYIDSERGSIARYCRYISRRLKCPSTRESETGFVNELLDLAKQTKRRMMVIPTGDRDLLALSKHKKELEQTFILPLPGYDIVQKLVNKKIFYKLLMEMQVPYPKTYFPENTDELSAMGSEIEYPYIIKPVYSPDFWDEFHLKCFVINSRQQLDRAIEKLKSTGLEVIIQDIIPGNIIYEFSSYFNRKSEPVGICGWDKLRQYPPDFGSGSFCESIWRSSEIDRGVRVLNALGYYGFAAVESKKDPRDGKYKLIEINARTTLQNRLAAACGPDMEYIAYLDANEQLAGEPMVPRDNVCWVDDLADLASRLINLKRTEFTAGSRVKPLRTGKVHSVMARDDPAPCVAYIIYMGFTLLRLLLGKIPKI